MPADMILLLVSVTDRMKQENEVEDMETNGRDSQNPSDESSASASASASACVPSESLLENPDLFYLKLKEFHNSAGMSLVSTAASSVLDLYSFYKQVGIRGGFLQITKDGRWHEVASALDYSIGSPQCAFLLQNVYSNLLLQFELIYGYRTSTQELELLRQGTSAELCGGSLEDSVGLQIVPQPQPSKEDAPLESMSKEESKMLASSKSKTRTTVNSASTANKQRKKDREAPRARRSAYQIFLHKECDRLKKKHGKSAKIRQMAINTWKTLADGDRLPYVEESNKDKERFNREMLAYNERKGIKSSNKAEFRIFNSEKKMNEFHNDNRVPIKFEESSDDMILGEEGGSGSMFGFAAELMGNALDLDATLQIDDRDDEFLSLN